MQQLRDILNFSDIEAELAKIPNLQQVILVPHRDLHRLPLHALFESSLLEQLTLIYLPSIQIGLNLQQRSISTTPRPQKALLSIQDPATQDLNQMPFAELESVVINAMFDNVTSLSGEEATRDAVFSALQSAPNLLHFTGHGYYNSSDPQQSALALADDERLTVADLNQSHPAFNLDALKDSLELVTLAACETAVTGRSSLEDEYVGLASAFLQAGANQVISSVWSVEETSNAWLMIRFYQLWLDNTYNASTAQALRDAQQWLRTRTCQQLAEWIMEIAAPLESQFPIQYDGLKAQATKLLADANTMGSDQSDYRPYEDPYYWAAFTLTGKLDV